MKYLDKATFQKISETKATLLKFASVVTTFCMHSIPGLTDEHQQPQKYLFQG